MHHLKWFKIIQYLIKYLKFKIRKQACTQEDDIIIPILHVTDILYK